MLCCVSEHTLRETHIRYCMTHAAIKRRIEVNLSVQFVEASMILNISGVTVVRYQMDTLVGVEIARILQHTIQTLRAMRKYLLYI